MEVARSPEVLEAKHTQRRGYRNAQAWYSGLLGLPAHMWCEVVVFGVGGSGRRSWDSLACEQVNGKELSRRSQLFLFLFFGYLDASIICAYYVYIV